MGYRRIPTIYTLDKIKDEDGLIVRMKSISFGKVRRLIALLDGDTGNDEVMGAISDQLVANLVSWNLEDEHGVPVPETAQGIDDQDFDLILKIVESWLDQITGPDAELGKGSPSGASFPGQPLTMEAL